MKKSRRTGLIILIVVLIVLAATAAQIILVFRLTSRQANEAGMNRLEAVCGELEETINDAKINTVRFSSEVQRYLSDKEKLKSYIYERKARELADPAGGAYNVYIAGKDWFIIPDFDAPEDYQPSKRSWYTGAAKTPGEPFVADPYVDALTGNICYTVSVMLTDNATVVATDYTMSSIQQHITQMALGSERVAFIVTDEGIIAGSTDETLIGKNLVSEMPDYSSIFSLIRSSDKSVSTSRQGENLFAARSDFGWYLIVGENNWSLYYNSYIQVIAMVIVSLLMIGFLIFMYNASSRKARRAEEALEENAEYISDMTARIQEPLQRITRGSSLENVRHSADYEQEFESIREAGGKLSYAVGELAQYNSGIREKQKEKIAKLRQRNEIKVSRHYRFIILAALMLVLAVSLYISITAAARYGKSRMQRTVSQYDQKLSSWISNQRSVLEMFSSLFAAYPELLVDYEGAVELLSGLSDEYPEISACYMANPDASHTVVMNTGWEPDEDWHVEDRDWYKELMSSDRGWAVSSPYYDEQTNYYCVTIAQVVRSNRTGEFIGCFGIDFYMDKLVDILGSSYTDDGYAFLTDSKGVILNHPYGSYQMSVNSSKNILELPYKSAAVDGEDVSLIKDYDDSFKTLIAMRNEDSKFLVYYVSPVWTNYGSVFIYAIVCIVVLGSCIVLVYKIMTSLIRLQEAANAKLKESADAAIAADGAKSSFLAQMSHEIRTPINAVLGMNEMIMRESTDKDIREYSLNIRSAGRSLLTLVNSILDFSKIEDGKMEIIPAEYSTSVLINDIDASIRTRAEEKKLTFTVIADSSLPSVLRGDDVRIKQVVSNLLTNAVKYTEKGSVKLVFRGEDRTEDSIGLYVEVTDTGIGIKEEDMGALFESFRRLEEKRNRNIEGTGLGMSIVTRLLDMMGSKLEVKSVYGEGSTFSFRLRQEIVSAEPIGEDLRSALPEEDLFGGKHLFAPDAGILVVDDNDMNLKVASSLMKIYGIVPVSAGSGYQAIEILREQHFDIVFLDHMMPKMDGIETLAKIREENLTDEHTTVIALTANAIVGAKETYLAAGFADYLTKPIEVGALEKCLMKYIPEEKQQFTENTAPAAKHEEAAPEDEDSFTQEELVRIRSICPELNVLEGLGYCMDSKEFYLETLADFAEADKLPLLDEAFEKQDLDSYRINVHSVKSAAKTVGADVVSDRARELEFAARDGDAELVRRKHPEFRELYTKLTENIRGVLNNE